MENTTSLREAVEEGIAEVSEWLLHETGDLLWDDDRGKIHRILDEVFRRERASTVEGPAQSTRGFSSVKASPRESWKYTVRSGFLAKGVTSRTLCVYARSLLGRYESASRVVDGAAVASAVEKLRENAMHLSALERLGVFG